MAKKEQVEDVVDVMGSNVNTEEKATLDVAAVEETSTAVATTTGGSNLGINIGPMELQFEWVKMVYAVGKKPASAIPGEYWLGKDYNTKIAERNGYFDAIIIGVDKGLKEWPKQYAPGTQLKYYATEAEAIKDGQTTDWSDGPNGTRVGPSVAPFIRLRMLIKKSECVEDETMFTIPLDGEYYAPAVMQFEKMNYKDAYNIIARAIQADVLRHKDEKGYVPNLNDKFFRISHTDETAKTGNQYTKLTLKLAIDDGKPALVPEGARKDLESLISMATQTTALADDEIPF